MDEAEGRLQEALTAKRLRVMPAYQTFEEEEGNKRLINNYKWQNIVWRRRPNFRRL